MATATMDQQKLEAFMGKVVGDLSGTMATVLSILGDRLGLFKALNEGAATSAELAERAGISERYAREWLSAMTCAGYVEHDAGTDRFTLPPEHAPALAHELGPMFVGGAYQELKGMFPVLDELTAAFRTGGGVPQSSYGTDMWEGLARFTGGWFENLLVPVWVPAVPDVQQKLEAGCRLADVGCGHGHALIKLAEAFPNSSFVGYDVFQPAIDQARAAAADAGVAERITFEQVDAAAGIPGTFDVITTFDVVHDAVDPAGLVEAIRKALAPDGVYLMLEVNASDKLAENVGPLGTMFFGFSVLYCMTTSLAHEGAGLGTCGMHEPNVRAIATEAGFGSVERLPLENPFNVLYAIRP
jgi:SAM-dependent methyltransferase